MGVSVDKKRNVALIGHGSSGKTILAEAMLHAAKITNRMGSIEDGNTVSDYNPEETKRKYSIYSSVLPFEHRGHRITLIDCPGYLAFTGDMTAALNSVDAAIIVVNGSEGVEPQTRQAWQACERLGVPRLLYITGLAKENASFDDSLAACRQAFGKTVAPFAITIGEHDSLKGVINILLRKSYVKEGDSVVEGDIPDEYKDAVAEARSTLVESIIDLDESLFERYLADEEISDEELLHAMQEGASRGEICPAVGGSGKLMIGVVNLMDLIIDALPDPSAKGKIEGEKPDGGEDSRPLTADAPFAARVFKISNEGQLGDMFWFRVYSGSVKPGDMVYNPRTGETEKVSALMIMRGKTREDMTEASAGDIAATVKLKDVRIGDTLCVKDSPIVLPQIEYPNAVTYEAVDVDDKNDLEKVISTLSQYGHMDPTLRLMQDPETKEQVVYGMGPLHLDVANAFVKSKSGAQVKWHKPKVPYRETITVPASSQGRFKKQTGGRGKFGDVHVKLEPTERGKGFEFVDAVVGGVVPSRFLPAVEKGINEQMINGPLSGSTVIDIKATAYDGSHHPVDSDELSFKMAGAMAFKESFEKANPIILEPIYEVVIHTPEDYMGDVMADINGRRGRVQGMDQMGDMKIVRAEVPLGELYQYINTLRSMTQGQGFYEMNFAHYEQVPSNVQQDIVAEYKKKRAAEHS